MKSIFLVLILFSSSALCDNTLDYVLRRAPDYYLATNAIKVSEIKGAWLLECPDYFSHEYNQGHPLPTRPGRAVVFDYVDSETGLQTLNVALEVGEPSSWEPDIEILKEINKSNGLSAYEFSLYTGDLFLYQTGETYNFFVYNYWVQARSFCRSKERLW